MLENDFCRPTALQFNALVMEESTVESSIYNYTSRL